jgi:hypothetical protein
MHSTNQVYNVCVRIQINVLVLVRIAGYVMAPLYKYMWTYLAVDGIHT